MRGLSASDRPREKCVRFGASSLGDNELLAIIIGAGIRQMSALAVANAVLEAAGGLHRLSRVTRDELLRIRGLGATKATQIVAAVELGRRTLAQPPDQRIRLMAPRDAAAYLLPLFGGRPVEHFGVVLLDAKQRVIRTTVLSVGGLDASVVAPREIFREACNAGASSVVLFHNHPSGDPSPSGDDILVTRRAVMAGDLMGIEVADHLVLADASYCSLRETGRIPLRTERQERE